MDEETKPFWNRHKELFTLNGCITWGTRIVPPQGRKSLLDELHVGHPGMSRMKALARGLLWWPLLDRDIEDAVKQCISCQQNQAAPLPAPMQPWIWPTRPWSRLHIDFAGPMEGKMF